MTLRSRPCPVRMDPARMDPGRMGNRRMTAAALLVAAAVSACSTRSSGPAEVEIRGTNPNGGTAIATAPAPNAQGIIGHDGYQTVVAGEGETVAQLAQRAGLSASELAAYNGLTPSHQMRAGDELVLPPGPGGDRTGIGGTAVASPTAPGAPSGAPGPAGSIEQAPLPAVSDSSADPAPPPGAWSPALAEAAIDRSTGLNPDGSLGAPPSSVEPVPPEPLPRRHLESPGLGQYQSGSPGIGTAVAPAARPAVPEARPEAAPQVAAATPSTTPSATPAPSATLRLQKPVSGPVAIPFNKGAGPARNDGVDFAAPAGSPVVVAADGEVALVSQSLGGLGTIVLVRHQGELLTVYGRIDSVTVEKGDTVRGGEQIGVVSTAATGDPRMHFEVRRGAESLDPMQFL